MTTKAYLEQIQRLNRMIQNKLGEIDTLKTMACSVSVVADKENVKSSGDQDKLGSTVAKIVDLERETDEIVDKYIKKRQHIIDQIDAIEDIRFYDVLSLRYVRECKLDKIAKQMKYSVPYVKSLLADAINEFERLYKNEYMKKDDTE